MSKQKPRSDGLVVGVDVGTGSVRAAVFDLKGKMLGHGSRPIRIWRPQTDFVEQSSADIWRGCGEAIREALAAAGVAARRVIGLSFDATCSLVCLDKANRPLTVSPTGRSEQNIIVWMDHRAIAEAEHINATRHKVLRYVGGTVSPEMESPKLLWLSRHLKSTWRKAGRFLDLADFLTFQATGDDTRSLCTTVCKWTYQGHLPAKAGSDSVGRWDDSFWRQIGLGELVDEGYSRIGTRVRPMGEPVGEGLTVEAARTLGLNPGTPVGVGIIDAHAGGLGMLGAKVNGQGITPQNCEARLALIGGTSSCHMITALKARFVRGIWGPYYSAMIPGYWLTEGGQSATGALIDHCIESSSLAPQLHKEARRRGMTVYELLNERLVALAGPRPLHQPTERVHVLGDHHGNRSPRANPQARGMEAGLTLGATIDELAVRYLATVQAVAYGTRHIIEAMNAAGYRVRELFACGGGTKNPVFLSQHADATGCPIYLPQEPEAVLLGTAVLAAVAAGAYVDPVAAMRAMNRTARTIRPAGGATRKYHDRKYRVYLQMYRDQQGYDKLMRR